MKREAQQPCKRRQSGLLARLDSDITYIASWKLMAFCPATARSWGLHLMLMISSSGRRSPLRAGYLTSRQSQGSPCSSHSTTPQAASLVRSTRYTSWRLVAEMVQVLGSEFSSSTGGAACPGGSRRTAENLDWDSILRQWISARRREY